MSGLGARPLAPTVLWLGAIATAGLASLVVDDAAIPVAAGAAVLAMLQIRGPLAIRLLTVAAMAPVAFLDASPTWAWIAAGVAIGLATSLVPRPGTQPDVTGDLQRHLAWCRRREEPAHLLVLPLADVQEKELRSLLESFRITDSVTLGRNEGDTELYALLDGHGFVQEGLERRLAERSNGSRLGWASFPNDGVTLQTLIDHARTEMREARDRVTVLEPPIEAHMASERTAPAPALEHAAAGRS
jgi:hypothetical protein